MIIAEIKAGLRGQFVFVGLKAKNKQAFQSQLDINYINAIVLSKCL